MSEQRAEPVTGPSGMPWRGAKKRETKSTSSPGAEGSTRISLNTALLLTVAVELVSAKTGLGAMAWFAWETLHTEELYASLVVTAALGVIANLLLRCVAARARCPGGRSWSDSRAPPGKKKRRQPA